MNLARSVRADVLRIIDNHQGPVYLVFSDIDLAQAPFTGDAFKTLQRAFPQVAWKSR